MPLPPGEIDATASGEGAPPAEEAQPTAETAGKPVAVTIPDIGDYQDVPVIEVLVAEGETVEKDQTLLVLESDKATLDVPAPAAGVVSGLKLKVGDKVAMGVAVCTITGAVRRPRVVEVAMGTTLEELLSEAGGVAAGLALQWLWDIRATGLPGWYPTLRTLLSAGALAGLAGGLAVLA